MTFGFLFLFFKSMFNNCDLFVDIRGVARQKGAVGTICGDSKFKGLRTTSSITQKLARYRSNQSVPLSLIHI